MLGVAFRHFYPGFKPSAFWLPVLELATERPVIPARESEADLVITSVFESYTDVWRRRLLSSQTHPSVPSASKRANPCSKQIWITGENIRPPVKGFDLTISFDVDTYAGNNVYFPLILETLDWGFAPTSQRENSQTSRGAPILTPQLAASPRVTATSSRPKFACAFIGNPEPIRMRAIDALRRHGDVDVFGSAVGRPIVSKAAIASEYRFMLCFENDIYPGYVTEKVVEAYACGCVPLWRGSDSIGLLNSSAMVNAFDFSSLESWAEFVAELDQKSSDIDEMASSRLLNEVPTLEALTEAIRTLTTHLN